MSTLKYLISTTNNPNELLAITIKSSQKGLLEDFLNETSVSYQLITSSKRGRSSNISLIEFNKHYVRYLLGEINIDDLAALTKISRKSLHAKLKNLNYLTATRYRKEQERCYVLTCEVGIFKYNPNKAL